MIQIDAFSRVPVYEQIIRQTERLILNGLLAPEDQMPSVRSLSLDLSINPNTIQKAYSDLMARGVLLAVPGKGCFVSPQAPALLRSRKRSELEALTHMVAEWKQAGVTLEEIEQCVRDAYHAPFDKKEDTL
ncbi:MAG: GntR family transcriptional regulator [Clostridia bacterium]|nr:GntR family transcriptional regulator [Clostridia bacterium]